MSKAIHYCKRHAPYHEEPSGKTSCACSTAVAPNTVSVSQEDAKAQDKPPRNERRFKLMTAESVRRGHPDKFCDQLADAILDEHLRQDPNAHVAIEAFVTDGKLLIAGEVTSKATVDYHRIVDYMIQKIGYASQDMTSTSEAGEIEVEVTLHEQSPDIRQAVDHDESDIGAGDQGIMVGYATNETDVLLPLPVVLAHRLCEAMDEYDADWIGRDGKAQVTVAYLDNLPLFVHTIVISTQHEDWKCMGCLKEELLDKIVLKCIPVSLIRPSTRILINPSGRFVLGGPVADTGLTGRKLAVDQYGPFAPTGGGALSGKDPTKVDRSGAYMARYIAVNIVAAGLAKRCEVQLAYAIGRSTPVSATVNTFGTNVVPEKYLEKAVKKVFDLTPAGIISSLSLRNQRYRLLACYGHFGRADLNLPWEKADKATQLIDAVKQLME